MEHKIAAIAQRIRTLREILELTPEEMAEVACFLLSDEARYVNGANFVCDGGKTLQ